MPLCLVRGPLRPPPRLDPNLLDQTQASLPRPAPWLAPPPISERHSSSACSSHLLPSLSSVCHPPRTTAMLLPTANRAQNLHPRAPRREPPACCRYPLPDAPPRGAPVVRQVQVRPLRPTLGSRRRAGAAPPRPPRSAPAFLQRTAGWARASCSALSHSLVRPATTSDLSTRPPRRSRIPSSSMPPPEHTASAASSVHPPANTESLRNTARSASESNPWLQSRVALNVRWRGSAVRLWPLSTSSETSSLWATCSTVSAPILAVASSMARGIPSSLRHTLATAPAFFSCQPEIGQPQAGPVHEEPHSLVAHEVLDGRHSTGNSGSRGGQGERRHGAGSPRRTRPASPGWLPRPSGARTSSGACLQAARPTPPNARSCPARAAGFWLAGRPRACRSRVGPGAL